jgi:hypothetical protein
LAKRGRPRKEKPATPEQINNIENMLGEPLEQFVQTFTDKHKRKMFSENLARQLKRTEWLTTLSSGNGQYQPVYSEQLLQQINVNPSAASSSDIEKWLLAPQYFDQNLRHLSQYLSYAVGQYNRSVSYLNTIKTYKYKLLPSDSDIEGNIDKTEYLHAYDICLRTLQKMNIRYQIPKVDYQTMMDGVSFVWVSETTDNISLLPLPADYCYITSPWTYGYLFAIDLVFFDQFITIPNQIPELKQAYDEFCTKREELYKGEKLAPYQYYQIPPDKGWVFTFDPIHPDKVPPLSSSMSSSLDILSYKELLKNKVALDLYKVIPMKIPLDKENKNMAISYKLAEEITQVIQSTLPENIKVFSSPFDTENAVLTDQSNRFDDIVKVSNNTFYSSSGFTKAMFGSEDNKMAAAMSISEQIDFGYSAYHPYRQYENFINFQLALKTKKYKFQIQMFGNLLNDTEERNNSLNEMTKTNSGILDVFAAKGYEPFQIKSTMILENALGLRDLMIPIQSMFNSNGKDNNDDKGGRPEATGSNISESNEATRSYDSNKTRITNNYDNNTQKCLYCGKEIIGNAVHKKFCSEDCAEEFAHEILDE